MVGPRGPAGEADLRAHEVDLRAHEVDRRRREVDLRAHEVGPPAIGMTVLGPMREDGAQQGDRGAPPTTGEKGARAEGLARGGPAGRPGPGRRVAGTGPPLAVVLPETRVETEASAAAGRRRREAQRAGSGRRNGGEAVSHPPPVGVAPNRPPAVGGTGSRPGAAAADARAAGGR
jgi:hypothetical protein